MVSRGGGHEQDSRGPGARRNFSTATVVLDFARPDLTNRAIRHLRASGDETICVVENGPPESAARVEDADFRLQAPRNLGFSGGMNLGIRFAAESGCEFVTLLNNDAIVTQGALAELVAVLRANPDVAVAVPVKALSVGLLDDRANIGTIEQNSTLAAPTRHRSGVSPEFRPVTKVTGFCMTFRMSALHAVGLLDEDFEFGKEDDEISLRMRAGGFRLAEVESSRVFHPVGSSTSLHSQEQVRYLVFNSARGNILLSRKARASTLSAVYRASFESLRVGLKGLVLGTPMPLTVAVSTLRGLSDGARSPLHRPPQL